MNLSSGTNIWHTLITADILLDVKSMSQGKYHDQGNQMTTQILKNLKAGFTENITKNSTQVHRREIAT